MLYVENKTNHLYRTLCTPILQALIFVKNQKQKTEENSRTCFCFTPNKQQAPTAENTSVTFFFCQWLQQTNRNRMYCLAHPSSKISCAALTSTFFYMKFVLFEYLL